MLLITRLIVILVGVNYQKITCNSSHTVGSVFIDDITNTYINIEEKLWALIGSSNQSDLVLNIHREHLNFFRNSFSIDRRRTESFKANFEKMFGWEVQSLNSEIEFVKNFGLQDSLDDISDDSVQMAKTYVGYDTIMANIYNRTVALNVFEQIKQVSMFFKLILFFKIISTTNLADIVTSKLFPIETNGIHEPNSFQLLHRCVYIFTEILLFASVVLFDFNAVWTEYVIWKLYWVYWVSNLLFRRLQSSFSTYS